MNCGRQRKRDTSFFNIDAQAYVAADDRRYAKGNCTVSASSELCTVSGWSGARKVRKIVGRAGEALVTSKKTGTSEIDIIVEYVKCCRARGSSLGGLGGQKMWDFQYLCQFTQRDPSSFCKDLMARAILARAGISEASVTARAQTRMWVKTGPSSTRQPLLLSSFS